MASSERDSDDPPPEGFLTGQLLIAMPSMADEQDRVPARRKAEDSRVHPRHQGARGIQCHQAAVGRLSAYRRRDPMRREDGRGAQRNGVRRVDEDRPAWVLAELTAASMKLSYKPLGAEVSVVRELKC